MEAPANFKLDVRVRDRMLIKGTISETEVQKHLDGLPDRESESEVIELAQPAVTPPGERPPVSARPAPRPAPPPLSAPLSVAPPPLAVDEGWGDEEEDDDDDDDDDGEGGDKAGEGGDKAGEGGDKAGEGGDKPDGGAPPPDGGEG